MIFYPLNPHANSISSGLGPARHVDIPENMTDNDKATFPTIKQMMALYQLERYHGVSEQTTDLMAEMIAADFKACQIDVRNEDGKLVGTMSIEEVF